MTGLNNKKLDIRTPSFSTFLFSLIFGFMLIVIVYSSNVDKHSINANQSLPTSISSSPHLLVHSIDITSNSSSKSITTDSPYRIPPVIPSTGCQYIEDGSGIILPILRSDGTMIEKHNYCIDNNHLVAYVCLPRITDGKISAAHEITCNDYQYCNSSARKCVQRYTDCHDSDSTSSNPLMITGTVSVHDELTGAPVDFTDYCGPDGLHEYSCDSTTGYTEIVYPTSSHYGCEDGHFVYAGYSDCEDNEIGIDPFFGGEINVTWPDLTTETYYDRVKHISMEASDVTGDWWDDYDLDFNMELINDTYCNDTCDTPGYSLINCSDYATENGIANCVRVWQTDGIVGNDNCDRAYCVADQCTHVADKPNKNFLYKGQAIGFFYPCDSYTLDSWCIVTQGAIYLGIYNGPLYGNPETGEIEEGHTYDMSEPGWVVERGYHEPYIDDHGLDDWLWYWEQYKCGGTGSYTLTRSIEQCVPGSHFHPYGSCVHLGGDDDGAKDMEVKNEIMTYDEWMKSGRHKKWLNGMDRFMKRYSGLNGYKYLSYKEANESEYYLGYLGYLTVERNHTVYDYPIMNPLYMFWLADKTSPVKGFKIGEAPHYEESVDKQYFSTLGKFDSKTQQYFKDIHKQFRDAFIKALGRKNVVSNITQTDMPSKEVSKNVNATSTSWPPSHLIADPYRIFCKDSDSGITSNEQGTVRWTPLPSLLSGGEMPIEISMTDYCANDNTVYEFYCDRGKPRMNLISCEDGKVCSDGACIPRDNVNYYCNDSDGGFVVNVSGHVQIIDAHTGEVLHDNYDTCLNNLTLIEYYCRSPYDSNIMNATYDAVMINYSNWRNSNTYLMNCSSGQMNEIMYKCIDPDYDPFNYTAAYATPSYVTTAWPFSGNESYPDYCPDDGRQIGYMMEQECARTSVDHSDPGWLVHRSEHRLDPSGRGFCYCNYSEDDIEHASTLRCSNESGYGPPHYYAYNKCRLAGRDTTLWYFDEGFWGPPSDPMARPPWDKTSYGGNITFGFPDWDPDAFAWNVYSDTCVWDWETGTSYLYIYYCNETDPEHEKISRDIYTCSFMCDWTMPISYCDPVDDGDGGKKKLTDEETIERLDNWLAELNGNVGISAKEVRGKFGNDYYKAPEFDKKFRIWKSQRYLNYLKNKNISQDKYNKIKTLLDKIYNVTFE
ncbi:hypothetical protein J7J26_00010 [Candidatus Micrarchaeota archaeon]|nr:hypothetical protein [Candidatus Micrarchaeota archaeon]